MADAIDLIQALMDERGLKRSDIFPSRSRASECMNRKRPLSIDVIRKLHFEFGVSAEVLISPYLTELATPSLQSKDGGQEVEAVGEAAELARLRAIALDMQAGYVEATERAEEAVKAANALQTEVDLLRSTSREGER